MSKPTLAASGDNRTRLLNLSADLFATDGYSRVSVRDLAQRLGLTTGVIYSNFRSKGDLLAEVLDLRIREEMEGSRTRMPLPEYVRRGMLRLKGRSQMRALILEAAAAARTDEDLRARLRPTLNSLLERWTVDYSDWQRASHVDRRIDAPSLVRSLWSIELGLGVLDANGALRAKPEEIAGFVSRFLDFLEGSDDHRAEPGRKAGSMPSSAQKWRTRTNGSSGQSSDGVVPVTALRDSAKAVVTQSLLIEAAINLFAERGYANVTVRDLARETGMTTGSIYGNFTNKATLLVEAIEVRIAQDLEQLPQGLVESGSPADLVEFNLRAFNNRTQLRALLVEGAAAARSDEEVRGHLQELQLRHLDLWEAGFEEWLAVSEEPPTTDMRTAVTVIWSAEMGLGLLEALDLETPTPRALARIFGLMCTSAGLSWRPSTLQNGSSPRRVARSQA
ncbi:MAG: TetR/AcrR family transcriptional regulator [Acidimicrobiales bacterium]